MQIGYNYRHNCNLLNLVPLVRGCGLQGYFRFRPMNSPRFEEAKKMKKKNPNQQWLFY